MYTQSKDKPSSGGIPSKVYVCLLKLNWDPLGSKKIQKQVK